MPLVSVCIFTTRCSRLNKTLRSVLQQKLPKYVSLEVLIIDSDADRASSHIIKNVKKDRLVTLNYQYGNYKNKSLSKNSAILHAKGEWIVFLGEGDIVKSNWLAALLDNAMKNNSQVVIADSEALLPPDISDFFTHGEFFSYQSQKVNPCLPIQHSHNILIHRKTVIEKKILFSKHHGLRHTENIVFFNQLKNQKLKVSLCPEAVFQRHIQRSKLNLSYLMKKSILIGESQLSYSKEKSLFKKLILILLSLTSISLALILMVILFPFSQVQSCKLLLRSCYKIGKINCLLGSSSLQLKKQEQLKLAE